MSKIYFKNEGLIDLVAVTTFGVNAKDNDNPIGYFGTGLKYAIAVILREGGSITLYRGLEEFVFHTKSTPVRQKSFDLVYMNDAQLGFTLELGKNWDQWQAYRELQSNTLDENGITTCTMEVKPEEGHTLFVVDSAVIATQHANRGEIFLQSSPIQIDAGIEVHKGSSDYGFYRGIRAMPLDRTSAFTYNITSSVQLTEDRTIADTHSYLHTIRRAVIAGENKELMRSFIAAKEGTFEASMDMEWSITPSKEFLSVMKEFDFKGISNYGLVNVYNKATAKKFEPTPGKMNDIEKEQLERACIFCESLNYNVRKYPIHVTDDLRHNTIGIAYLGEVYLNRRAFQQGTKMVAITLLEEFLHLDRDLRDCDRDMQNYLFDIIVTLGERLTGQPI